jgi:hypothetical protein
MKNPQRRQVQSEPFSETPRQSLGRWTLALVRRRRIYTAVGAAKRPASTNAACDFFTRLFQRHESVTF